MHIDILLQYNTEGHKKQGLNGFPPMRPEAGASPRPTKVYDHTVGRGLAPAEYIPFVLSSVIVLLFKFRLGIVGFRHLHHHTAVNDLHTAAIRVQGHLLKFLCCGQGKT